MPEVGHTSHVFALDLALLQPVLARISGNAADVRRNGDIIDIAAVNGLYPHQHTVTDTVAVSGIAEPINREIPGEDNALNTEHLYTQGLFRNAHDPGLNDTPLIDQRGPSRFADIHIESLALAEHGGSSDSPQHCGWLCRSRAQ